MQIREEFPCFQVPTLFCRKGLFIDFPGKVFKAFQLKFFWEKFPSGKIIYVYHTKLFLEKVNLKQVTVALNQIWTEI